MNIHIASDHAGFDLKEQLKTYITQLGHTVTDHGAFTIDTSDDYPDFVTPCAEAVAADEQSGDLSRVSRGIVIGGSGQGEAMDANRITGVRATEYYGGDVEIVRISREHNNANVLSLGARFMSEEEAKLAVKVFLETEFSSDPRHERRLEKF